MRDQGRQFREEPGQELVVTVGEAHGEVLPGAPVELGSTTCARAGTSRETAVFGREQADRDQLVEMERRQRAAEPERVGRLVTAHCIGLAFDELVEPLSVRFEEGSQRLEPTRDGRRFHPSMVGRPARSPEFQFSVDLRAHRL